MSNSIDRRDRDQIAECATWRGPTPATPWRQLCDCGATLGTNHDCPIMPSFNGADLHETTEEGDGDDGE